MNPVEIASPISRDEPCQIETRDIETNKGEVCLSLETSAVEKGGLLKICAVKLSACADLFSGCETVSGVALNLASYRSGLREL